MTASVEIKTGSPRLPEYLLPPLVVTSRAKRQR